MHEDHNAYMNWYVKNTIFNLTMLDCLASRESQLLGHVFAFMERNRVVFVSWARPVTHDMPRELVLGQLL